MSIFSAYSEDRELNSAVNAHLLEDDNIGDCCIKETHYGAPILVTKNCALDNEVYFIPCNSLEQAIELAVKGIWIMDINQFRASILDYPNRHTMLDYEVDTIDIAIAAEIAYWLYKFMKEKTFTELLPTKTLTLR